MIQPNRHLLDLDRITDNMGQRENYVCMDRNERLVPFSQSDVAAMQKIFSSKLLNRYPNPVPLYERLSRKLKIPRGRITLTNGSDAAIRMLFQAHLAKGDKVILPEPSYAMYSIYTRIFRGRPLPVPYGRGFSLDVERVLALMKFRPRILVIANPDQPTGAVLPAAALRRLARETRRRNILFIIDEAYYPFCPQTSIPMTLEHDNVAVTRTFSKAYGLAGLRLGYAVAHPRIIKSLSQIRGAHEVNAAAISLGCYVLDHPHLYKDYLVKIEEGKRLLKASAVSLGLGFPACPTNFQLIAFPDLDSTTGIVERLKLKGILVKGGFKNPAIQNCIRVTLGDSKLMNQFIAALKSVLKETGWSALHAG
jgi:histidinol-phosphate aminotransferase